MISNSTKYCCYCKQIANTRDHIPSKNLLEKPYPRNLLTVPCCLNCNKSFSLDEEYFLNVLVEISTNNKLSSKKEEGGTVHRARMRSPKLKNRISESLFRKDDGKIYFHSETNRIKRVIEKNAVGLFIHKYGVVPNKDSFNCNGFYPFTVEETRPAEIFMLTYTEKFTPKKWTTIQENVFSYIVVKDWTRGNKLTMIFHVYNSVWCIIEIPHPNAYGYQRKNNKFLLKLFK